jgi:hypothetical protein
MDNQFKKSDDATVKAPNFHKGPVHSHEDVSLKFRYFTYGTETGLVSGIEANAMFTVERPASMVWAAYKDWNRWMNSYGYFWSGVIGDLYSREARDLGDESFTGRTEKPGQPSKDYPYQYRVLRITPERMIVVYQPIPDDGSTGGVSPGFHVFLFNERNGITVVAAQMEHATRTKDKSVDEALVPWRELAPEYMKMWRDTFIPNLKALACAEK